MRRDTTAGEFVGCTKAQTTHWCAAGRLSALDLAAKRGDEASAWAVNVSGVKAATFSQARQWSSKEAANQPA